MLGAWSFLEAFHVILHVQIMLCVSLAIDITYTCHIKKNKLAKNLIMWLKCRCVQIEFISFLE